MSGFQRTDSHLFDVVHGQVDVFPVMAVVGVAVVFHLIGLVIVAARVVHHHDEAAVQFLAYHFLVERLRRELTGLADSLSLLVAEGIGKGLHGFANGELQHVVDLSQHARLGFLQRCAFLAFLHHLAQLKPELTQF